MQAIQKQFKRILFFVRLPEFQVFWILLPFVLAVLIFTIIDVPVPPWVASTIIVGFMLVVLSGVFYACLRLAKGLYDEDAERFELRSIIASITDALVVYDEDFKIVFFNPAAEKLFTLRADDVIGSEVRPQIAEQPQFRLLAQVIFPSLAPTLIYRSKTGQYPQIIDVSFEDPFLELRALTSPIVNDKGVTVGFMKLITNRTQEASLLRSKNEFITVASHQLRTPITEVNWALDTIVSDPQLPPALHEMTAQTANSAKKILNIVEDLLNITKIEEGHFGYELAPTDLAHLLEEALSGAMVQIERAGLKIYFDRPPTPLPLVNIDPKKISMVVANLIDNAVRYNVAQGTIIVGLHEADDRRFVQVTVKDTGIGIPPNEAKKIFIKFYRGSNALKFHTDGSGLGLWIARNIVRAHGGEIWAESEVNRGTTFYFTLPIDPSITPSSEIANAPVID